MKPYLIGCGLDVLGGNLIAEIMILFLTIYYGKFHTNTKVEKIM